MIVINIIAYIALIILICVVIINPILMLIHLKKKKKACWYRQLSPYKHLHELYIIPTIKISYTGPYTEVNLCFWHYGIYIAYNMLTETEDMAMDEAYWNIRERDDKSK